MTAENSKKRVPGRPFPKGVSGNPGGRPKSLGGWREACQARTEAVLRALDEALTDPERAVKAAQILAEFAWGKATQPVEHSGPGGDSIRVSISLGQPKPKEKT